MPLPENYLPRKGDILILHGTVKYDASPGESVHVTVDGDYGSRMVPLDTVIGVHCRQWMVGEEVREHSMKARGEVVAQSGDQVWIKYPTGSMSTVHANALTLVPAPEDCVIAEPPTTPEE